MKVTHVFSRAIAGYKRNPKFVVPHVVEFALEAALIVVTALIVILATLAFLPSLAMGDLMALLFGHVPVILITLLIFLALLLVILITLFGAAARVAIITMAQETHTNETTDLGSGLNGVRRFTAGVFLFRVLLGTVFLVMIAIGLVPFVLGSFFFGIFALILALLLYLVFYLFAFFTPQFIVTRGVGVIAGIKDSMEFVEKNFSSVLIYVAVAIAISLGLALITNVLALTSVFIENQVLELAFTVFHIIFSIGLGLVIAPYFDIVKTYMVMEEV
ncbi:MAG: hypothetical protein ACE5G7_04145 [Candidatus Hydrothermarchaeaceae archaeon]